MGETNSPSVAHGYKSLFVE